MKKQAFSIYSVFALLAIPTVNVNRLIEWYQFDETMRRQRVMRIIKQASCSGTDTPRVHQGPCWIVYYAANKPGLKRSTTIFFLLQIKINMGKLKSNNTILFVLAPSMNLSTGFRAVTGIVVVCISKRTSNTCTEAPDHFTSSFLIFQKGNYSIVSQQFYRSIAWT